MSFSLGVYCSWCGSCSCWLKWKLFFYLTLWLHKCLVCNWFSLRSVIRVHCGFIELYPIKAFFCCHCHCLNCLRCSPSAMTAIKYEELIEIFIKVVMMSLNSLRVSCLSTVQWRLIWVRMSSCSVCHFYSAVIFLSMVLNSIKILFSSACLLVTSSRFMLLNKT